MVKIVTPELEAKLTANIATFCHLLELEFESGTLRITTAAQDILVNGIIYTAVGGNLTFDSVKTAIINKENGVRAILSGIDQLVVAIVLNANYLNRDILIYEQCFDEDTGLPIDQPQQIFSGKMNGGIEIENDVPETNSTDSSPGDVTVIISCQDILVALDTPGGMQTNENSHSQFFPGDKFFDKTNELEKLQIVWGQPN